MLALCLLLHTRHAHARTHARTHALTHTVKCYGKHAEVDAHLFFLSPLCSWTVLEWQCTTTRAIGSPGWTAGEDMLPTTVSRGSSTALGAPPPAAPKPTAPRSTLPPPLTACGGETPRSLGLPRPACCRSLLFWPSSLPGVPSKSKYRNPPSRRPDADFITVFAAERSRSADMWPSPTGVSGGGPCFTIAGCRCSDRRSDPGDPSR